MNKIVFNYLFTIFVGNSNDPGIIPRTLVLVFNSIGNKLMSDCKYKPDKVIAAHILDEKLIENEENIRNNILNNWANDKIQVNIEIYCTTFKCSLNNYCIFYCLRMNLNLVHFKLMMVRQCIALINLLRTV